VRHVVSPMGKKAGIEFILEPTLSEVVSEKILSGI
jgi:hypothetical protein